MNVLILEDDPVSLKKTQLELEALSHNVFACGDVIEALSLFGQNQIDLVISDLELPLGSGFDFIQDVRELNKKIPILIISGTISKEGLAILKKFNCTDILVKPARVDRIQEVLSKI